MDGIGGLIGLERPWAHSNPSGLVCLEKLGQEDEAELASGRLWHGLWHSVAQDFALDRFRNRLARDDVEHPVVLELLRRLERRLSG